MILTSVFKPELDGKTEEDQVMLAITRMKSNRAPGEDEIPPGVFRALNGHFIGIFTTMFNHVLNTGEYPAAWSTVYVLSIYVLSINKDPRVIQTIIEVYITI